MSKRVGIITHYFNSTNFGGNLQAFALCELLRKNGCQAKQISYDCMAQIGTQKAHKSIFSSFISKVKKAFNKEAYLKAFDRILSRFKRKKVLDNCKKKKEAFFVFNQEIIPHTVVEYFEDTIEECIDQFDCFITGSDQVWNPIYYLPGFFLSFVPSDKIKISYAASIATNELSPEQAKLFQNHLRDYKAISVREDSAVELIQPLVDIPVEHVLDPTMLLSKEDWDKVCSDRIVQEDYVLCYFLGYNTKERKLAKKYAKKNKLKLVTIPMINYGISVVDQGFGDLRMDFATPQDFLSLIKYAKYVFTDSFHAVVFSNIYQKQYFVFNRSKKHEMSSRIIDITKLFEQEERFCVGSEREKLEYLISLPDIDYSRDNKSFEKMKEKSITFLMENLQ